MSKSSLPAATTSSPLTSFGSRRRAPRLSPLRSAALLGVLALPLALVCASCLNPETDFDQFVDRAADATAPPMPSSTSEASTIDVASLRAPDASFDDTKFAMICISQLGQDISEALLWVVDLKYDKSDGGPGGTLTYTSNSLAAHSTDINSPLPGTLVTETATIDSHGAGNIGIASSTLPAAANGIGGTPVGLANVVEAFHIESPTQICATLGAQIMTMGAVVTLVPDENPCIFLPTDSKGQWGPVTTDQVHCP